ncbi:MAG: tetratricopeptide repeat protein [Parvularculaceae bacterium]
MAVRQPATARTLSKYAGASLCAILMSACATSGADKTAGGDTKYKDAVGVFANPEADVSTLDPIAAAAFWGTRYDREPQNPEAAVRYSNALRKIGSTKEAVKVMSKAAERTPSNPDVNVELGKALVEDGRAFEAVRHFETALAARQDDWRTLSAYGVALDQIGEHETARLKYDAALRVAPDAVSVMNNKGLSYALSGDLSQAVATLRGAVTNRRGDARVRQNLALVLAIKGDMKEAERLARSDLPPQLAEQNIAYFRSLLNQPAYWQDYADSSVDVPSFEETPSAPATAPSKKPQPLPKLREEPKQEDDKDDGKPIAQGEPQPLTPASDIKEIEAAPDLKNY